MQNEMNTKTATIAVLYGYNTAEELADGESCAAVYFLGADELPYGGWSSQGMIEVAEVIAVSVDSAEFDSAKSNSAIENRWRETPVAAVANEDDDFDNHQVLYGDFDSETQTWGTTTPQQMADESIAQLMDLLGDRA